MVLLGICIILAGVWHYINSARCQKVVVLYQALLTIGISLTLISVIFWHQLPTSDHTCMARIWLTCLGYTIVLSGVFERTWHIYRVYGKLYKSSKLTVSVTG